MNHISLTVCKDLKFNVSWVLHKVLNVHGSIPKCNLGFLLCGEKCQFKFLWGKRLYACLSRRLQGLLL